MFFIIPSNILLGQIIVGLIGVGFIALTPRIRKGTAFTLDYLSENKGKIN
ncbi:MAG: hypothetical protein HY276_06110 [Ignavibacteriales bacterium]|nr:hypothetical protein [Ignavibacteriales bacterium]